MKKYVENIVVTIVGTIHPKTYDHLSQVFLFIELAKRRQLAISMQEGVISLSKHRKFIHDLKEAQAKEFMVKKMKYDKLKEERKKKNMQMLELQEKFQKLQEDKKQMYNLAHNI